MKILKKAKFKPITCSNCGCIYKPTKPYELEINILCYKTAVRCPTCSKFNEAQFVKKEVVSDENANSTET